MKLNFEEMQSISKDTSPHKFEEIGAYKNVTVQILRCPHCGEISIGWMRQPDTEELDKLEAFYVGD